MTTRPMALALLAGGLCAPGGANAVRLHPDGHGQALIYPYYTARSASGNAFVSLLSVTNGTATLKAVKVRIYEGRAGAEVFDFNLFLSAYDVWTAGILRIGDGAGIFTSDRSCIVPAIARSAANPSSFRSAAYAGDGYGDSPDRTLEGYLEVLEMGTIDPNADLALSVTHVPDFSSPNASSPPCTGLPLTDAVPIGLAKPTGGLIGNLSYVNVNEGTDYSVDAVALSQWSDKVQWSAAGSPYPGLADASPPASVVVAERGGGDVVVRSEWANGRDAVSAVLMAEKLANDFSSEPFIKSATDWVITMPTRRFHVAGSQFAPPFLGNSIGLPRAEVVGMRYFDRERQTPVPPLCLVPGPPCDQLLPFATTVLSFPARRDDASSPTVFGSASGSRVSSTELPPAWISGWAEMRLGDGMARVLVAPAGKSTVTNATTGLTAAAGAVTYHGLPVVGFSVQSYSTTGLPGIDPNVLSNYGGSFLHKLTRRVDIVD